MYVELLEPPSGSARRALTRQLAPPPASATRRAVGDGRRSSAMVTLARNCGGMFVRCTSSTRSCSERWLSSRVVATLLAIVPLLLLEPTRRPLLSGLQAQRFRVRLEDNMTIIKGSDGSWTWNGGKEGAQRFDELAQAEEAGFGVSCVHSYSIHST